MKNNVQLNNNLNINPFSINPNNLIKPKAILNYINDHNSISSLNGEIPINSKLNNIPSNNNDNFQSGNFIYEADNNSNNSMLKNYFYKNNSINDIHEKIDRTSKNNIFSPQNEQIKINKNSANDKKQVFLNKRECNNIKENLGDSKIGQNTINFEATNEELKNKIKDNIELETNNLIDDKKLWRYINFVDEYLRRDSPVTLDFSSLKKEEENNILTQKDFHLGNFVHFYDDKKYLNHFRDERINYFDVELFRNKKCLDIGCNHGIFTILIAIKFHPKSIIGIDFDAKLIKKAIKNYKYVLRNNLDKSFIDNLFLSYKKDYQFDNHNILEEIMLKDKKNIKNEKIKSNIDKISIKGKKFLKYRF